MSRPGESWPDCQRRGRGQSSQLWQQAGERDREVREQHTQQTRQLSMRREKSVSCPVIEVARVGGLPECATYTAEFGRQLPGAGEEACSPEVGEPS